MISVDGVSASSSCGSSGGSAWITTRLLQGTSTSTTISARGGAAGSGQSGGGGGGRIALYCNASEHVGSFKGLSGVPVMQVSGGSGSSSSGGSGTAYTDCGDVGTALILDNDGLSNQFDHGSGMVFTDFLESNETTWHFDHLGVFGSGRFAFIPSIMGVSVPKELAKAPKNLPKSFPRPLHLSSCDSHVCRWLAAR